ncbi:MAG: autotransporter-associated N-terminal domain-containing protein, partial [Leptotrichia sp.]
MTDNYLRNLKKELKAFAKRVKDFKYTDSALITFLLTGMLGITGFAINLYSAEDEIKTQEHAINTSILQLQKDFKRARQENNKLLRTTNLELIQLMEQGDHVVKSPWSSWQYGMNYVNNNWNGEYKGRGDKVKDVKYTRSTGMDKYQYQRRGQLSYGGSTDITFPIEPNAAIPIAAALKPITPLAKNANLALNVDLSGLPAFEPTTVMPPVIPLIKAPEPQLNINLDINAGSRGSGEDTRAFTTSGDAPFESVAITSGHLDVKIEGNTDNGRTSRYDAYNVIVKDIHP